MAAEPTCGLGHPRSQKAIFLLLCLSRLLGMKEAMKGSLLAATLATTKGHISQLTHQKGTNSPLFLGSGACISESPEEC